MCYVGQAANLAERWKQHIKRGLGADPVTKNKLYPAMKAIGVENFSFEVIEECERSKLDEREDYWQDFFKAKEFGYSIIDKRGTGKTSRLMLLAKEENAIIACSNPDAMKIKAERYGIIGINFISYYDYVNGNYQKGSMVFIDELDCFVRSLGHNLSGYNLSNED